MEKYGSIYSIRNKINNKLYIGQTIYPVDIRWKTHIKDHKSLISRAIKKYGIINFEFKELCSGFSKAGLDYLEQYFIKIYNTTDRNIGYNLTFGGRGPQFTEEVRLKMRMAKLGKKRGSYANQSGSKEINKFLHAQRLGIETENSEYNIPKSLHYPSKYEKYKEEIIDIYTKTNSSYQVAQTLNLDKSTVCVYLKKWGKLRTQGEAASNRNKNRYKIEEATQILVKNTYNELNSYKKVSIKLNIPLKTIIRIIKG